MKSKIYGAHGSKWMLAVALLLIFSLALSPLVAAAKDSKKGNNNGGQDGTNDNVKEPKQGHQDDNNVHDGNNGKENHAKEDKHGPENNTPVDNNSYQDQPENNVQDQPQQPDQPDSPYQPDQSNNDVQDDPQPANSTQNDQTLTMENQEVEILESNESVQQPAQDSQPQELNEGLSDQTNSQQNQAGASVASTTASNVIVSFSEGLPILSVGFGIIVVFRLLQVWAHQRYLLQLIRFRISLTNSIDPFYKILNRVNQIQIHFGKIKCGNGFTKEEALVFFRKCQRFPLTLNKCYG